MRIAIVLVCLWGLPARGDEPRPRPPGPLGSLVRLVEIARAKYPVALVPVPPWSARRLLVVEKVGRVRPLDGNTLGAPILDLSARVTKWTEQGLLGLALHPRFAENRKLYVNFTDQKGDTRVVEYVWRGDAVDVKSERSLIFVHQPYVNHNGGNLAFGPDGRLWVGLGDGGSRLDPHGNGQNRDVLLGKMLRIDVDAAAAQPELVHIGLRNPWRYTFNRKTGDLYIADVGQDKFEEVDVVPATARGLNFGWNVVEGMGHCLKGASCNQTGMTAPVVEYTHKAGCSITGGYVYRGRALPELDGIYFYADYCTAAIWSLRWKDGRAEDVWDWKAALDPDSRLAVLSAWGEDGDGELYLLSLDGPIYKLVRR